MKIPKGGLHNINQSSQANINDSWNVLATDENNAVLIAVDKCGTKKTVGDTTEIKNSIQALEQENIEQDNRLTDIESKNIVQYDLINDLQTALNNKQDKLSSFDESILIESNGNIEGNVSLFTEYFNSQNCVLAFTPIQILGIYKNGIKLLQSEYTITLPKTISINTYTYENIEIQYTHLKN